MTNTAQASREWAYVLAAATLVFLGVLLYSTSSLDDAFMTFWPAHSLGSSGQILNYNGDRIEQSSSLLHVILLAMLSRLLPLPFPVLGYGFALGFGVLNVMAVARLGRLFPPAPPVWASFLAATSPYLLYWSVNSLEPTLAAFLSTQLVIVLVRLERRELVSIGRMTAILLPYLLVRPENVFILACTLGGLVAFGAMATHNTPAETLPKTRFRQGRFFLPMIGIASMFTSAIFLFRILYFGAFFPQPVTAKYGGLLAARVAAGARYVAQYGNWFPPFSLLCSALFIFGIARTWRTGTSRA